MDIERINFLAKKACQVSQSRLLNVDSVTGNLRAQLENVYIVDEKGNKVKYDKKRN